MSDFISREAAIAAIEAEIAKPFVQAQVSQYRAGFHGAIRVLNEAIPAADVAPVVRCGKCKNCNTEGCGSGCGWCGLLNIGVFEDFYCKHGALMQEGKA